MKAWKIIGITTMLLVSPPAAASNFPIFGNVGSASSDLKPFPKWNGVLERYFNATMLNATPCTSERFNPCQLKQWKQFLDSIQSKPLRQKVDAVNRFMNKTRYILDPINWGLSDYWATPYEFSSRNGDCEDYAIAKFISLRALGVPNDDMRLVILKDTNLNLMHAILVVNVDGEPMVLDNQIKQTRPANKIYHYKPIYSINETGWWLHQR